MTEERKKAAQNVGLDLTKNTSNQEIISGYLHFGELIIKNNSARFIIPALI